MEKEILNLFWSMVSIIHVNKKLHRFHNVSNLNFIIKIDILEIYGMLIINFVCPFISYIHVGNDFFIA
jgi:hypothetical protein